MTTPARIAAFLSTSALCLGLVGAPAQATSNTVSDPGARVSAPRVAATAEDPRNSVEVRRVQSAAPRKRG
ncbi:hypothetical protein [Bordetella trematum]|uniref:hypothetical protein n=1 Tax=Bordetella trematum TaxID=123899 RepID=UPI000470E753|nr:hypothetical protein [Bordetella trematum]